MIITITGKPCSGKGTVSKIFCDKYKFEYISAGQLMRDIAVEKNFEDILSFTQSDNIKDTDIAVEKWTAKIGETRLDEDIIIDARLAWFTIPKSFKVFIDVSMDTAAIRLFNSKRENEQVDSIEEAKASLIARWDRENTRYKKTYGVDNTDPTRYDLVISSENTSPQDIAEKIYLEYCKYIKK